MTANTKDTIYVDIDDEITAIIDKVRASNAKIVALVLPKRASVFQSIVNMKLLKRTAEAAKKHIVLITTEPNLMPLAAAVGLHVAATPQSKPEVPTVEEPADNSDAADEAIDEDNEDSFPAQKAGNKPIGELSGAAVAAPADGVETLDLPDDDAEGADDETPAAEVKSKKNRKLAVPNFNRFRLRLVLAVLLLAALVAGLVLAAVVLPKASVAISTNASTVNANFNVTLDTAAQALDASKHIVPAKAEQQQKTTSQQVATTGQKNTGDIAAGTVTMTTCIGGFGFPNNVPAGTGVSTNGLTFITQSSASFSPTGPDPVHSCYKYVSGSVAITAQNAGAKYNVDNATFTVAGRSDVNANGSASGGTDNIIQVVAQADIDSATQKLAAQDTNAIKASLEQTLQGDGMYPLPATFSASSPAVTTSNNVGDQAANVTVTQAVTYTMYGAKQADLVTLIKNAINAQIDASSQSILDDGLSKAKIGVLNTSQGSEQVSLQAAALVGPDINTNEIKKEIAGKKAGDVQSLIGNIPGVTKVEVQLSPFWVSTVPSNASKVQVTVSGAK